MAADSAARADVRRFVRQRFGNAPIAVYLDRTGAIASAFGVSSHPQFRFTTSDGRLTSAAPAGFPFR